MTSDGPDPAGYCQVAVGLADDLSIEVGLFLGDSKVGKVNPCDVTAQVAALMVTSLRKKPAHNRITG
jgi:hypothetical protein